MRKFMMLAAFGVASMVGLFHAVEAKATVADPPGKAVLSMKHYKWYGPYTSEGALVAARQLVSQGWTFERYQEDANGYWYVLVSVIK